MPLADFHRSDPFTLGIELELQVVNPPGYDLSQDASTLIADVQHELTVGEAKHDITESMLEIATGVCRDISHAQIQLSAIQQAVQRAALRHHLQICGGGSHPFMPGSASKSAITRAMSKPSSILAIWHSRRRSLASMCTSAARAAMTPSICCMACRALYRTSSPLTPPRRGLTVPTAVSPVHA